MQIKNLLGLSTEEFFTPVAPRDFAKTKTKKLEKPFEAKITVFSDPYFDKTKIKLIIIIVIMIIIIILIIKIFIIIIIIIITIQ